jgi:hypothetical protein
MVVLLTNRGKCSGLRAKPAKVSGQLQLKREMLKGKASLESCSANVMPDYEIKLIL